MGTRCLRWPLALSAFLLVTTFAGCDQVKVTEPQVCQTEIAVDPAGQPTVQVFAVGVVQDPTAMHTYADFTEVFMAAVRREAACFRKDIPNLIVFPENSALMAAFIGSRGEGARARQESVGAFADFFQTYQEPVAHYKDRFPGTPGIRALLIGMTDTLARAIELTFPVIAQTYGVYVAVSADVAPYESSTDPDLIAKLADPDLRGVTEAYVATAAEVYNYSIVYAPDGKEIGRVAKAYLVPDEESLLQLNYGSLDQMRPIETPFGKLAPVISKDGWMPDVLERFNELGATITLQHEAFSGWGVEQYEGDWLPDVVKQSLWNHVNAYDSFRYGVMPCITGNFLDLVFDCQSAIVKEVSSDDNPMRFIGQPAEKGFLDVGPWVLPDPIEKDPALSVEERRLVLRERGEALLPGSGSEFENDYVQSVARGGLYLADSPGDAIRSRVTDAASLEQGSPCIIEGPCPSAATYLIAGNGIDENAFRPDIAGGDQAYHIVYLLQSGQVRSVQYVRAGINGELTVNEPVTLPFDVAQPHKVAVTASSQTVYAMTSADLVEAENGGEGFSTHIGLARSLDGGRNWAPLPVTFNASPSAKYFPAVAASGERLYVTWTDRVLGSSDIMLAISDDRGETFRTLRLDEPHANQSIAGNPANTRNNQALPAVATDGDKIAVIWSDFRNYSWDIYGAASTDGGITWSPNLRLNPEARKRNEGDEVERILGPNSVSLRNGRLFVAADGVDDREPYRTVRSIEARELCDYLAVECVPGFTDRTRAGFKPSTDFGMAGNPLIVWHGVGESDNDIFAAVWADGAWGAPKAVVSGSGQQFNAKAAGGGFVWEDWRTGRGQIGLYFFGAE